MRQFKNILVGVDLSQADRFVSLELLFPSVEAVERAVAGEAKFRSLDVFYSRDVSAAAAARRMIEESDRGKESVLKESQDLLSGLVAQADADRVTANAQVRFGKRWIELIRHVLQDAHDLIVMGMVGRAGISGFITGNSSERLLARIPCSLVAVKPADFKSPVALERST